jgi:hypothetical protein
MPAELPLTLSPLPSFMASQILKAKENAAKLIAYFFNEQVLQEPEGDRPSHITLKQKQIAGKKNSSGMTAFEVGVREHAPIEALDAVLEHAEISANELKRMCRVAVECGGSCDAVRFLARAASGSGANQRTRVDTPSNVSETILGETPLDISTFEDSGIQPATATSFAHVLRIESEVPPGRRRTSLLV